jgi:hypothetical protein
MKEDVEEEQPWGRGKSWLQKIRGILLYYMELGLQDLAIVACSQMSRGCFVLYKGDS